MLDFWASTPIGQAESPPEKKLREVGEWLVDRTESRGLLGLLSLSLSLPPDLLRHYRIETSSKLGLQTTRKKSSLFMISFELGAQVSVILNAYDGLAGQRILMAVSLYVLPVWVLLLLLASGAVSLPFSVPFLDDLLS